MSRDSLVALLAPLTARIRQLDPTDPVAANTLATEFPLSGRLLTDVAALFRRGVGEGWLCNREAGGVRFSRVSRSDNPATGPLSIEAVSMNGAGPGHTHPQGEFDLCFGIDGMPTFDGHPPGFVVYPPGSWHVPTVTGGTMDILYFLPGGEIRFEADPAIESGN
jgi:hypothetical protein